MRGARGCAPDRDCPARGAIAARYPDGTVRRRSRQLGRRDRSGQADRDHLRAGHDVEEGRCRRGRVSRGRSRSGDGHRADRAAPRGRTFRPCQFGRRRSARPGLLPPREGRDRARTGEGRFRAARYPASRPAARHACGGRPAACRAVGDRCCALGKSAIARQAALALAKRAARGRFMHDNDAIRAAARTLPQLGREAL